MGRKLKTAGAFAGIAGLGALGIIGICLLLGVLLAIGSFITGCIIYAVVAWLLPVFNVTLGWTFYQCWVGGLIVCLLKGLLSPTITVNKS